MVEKQQFCHMFIISAGIRIIDVKGVFAFGKDPESSEKKLEALINLRTIASQGTITVCKIYLKIKCVASLAPHCGMVCLVKMAVGQSFLLHQFSIKIIKGTRLEIQPIQTWRRCAQCCYTENTVVHWPKRQTVPFLLGPRILAASLLKRKICMSN